VPAPRLLETRPPALQVVLATLPALVLGVVVGVVLDLSSAIYLLLALLSGLGAILAGREHRSVVEGAQRGLVGGLMWGAGVVLGHHLLSRRATVALPHPEALELIITSLVSIPLGAIGGALRSRREARAGGEGHEAVA
jgi:hypothetical protein